MHSRTSKLTINISSPFQIDGFDKSLPSGRYEVEVTSEVIDGMFLPASLEPSVLIHLQATPGAPGHKQTLSVTLGALEAVLLRDQGSKTMASHERRPGELLLQLASRRLT